MNYPKPEIQTFVQPPAAQYLYVPEYRFKIKQKTKKLSEFNVFDDIDFSGFNDGGITGAAVLPTTPRFNNGGLIPPPQLSAEPFELQIVNSSSERQQVNIFESYKNRIAPNFGNHPSVLVGGTSPRKYFEYLSQTEHQRCFIGRIEIEVLQKPKDVKYGDIFGMIQHNIYQSDGYSRHNPIPFFIDPRSFKIDRVEKNMCYELNGFAGFNFSLPKQTSILMKLFRLAQ